MRVLLDARSIDIWPYGVGRYATELTSLLPAMRPDWEWYILRYGPERTENRSGITLIWKDAPFDNYERQTAALSGLLNDIHPDLTHSFWYPSLDCVDSIKILTVHDAISEKGYPEFLSSHALRQNLDYRRSCHTADLIVAPSNATCKDLARIYSYPPERVRVIAEGASSCFHATDHASIEECRKKYSLPDRYIFCSAHHHLVSYKNTQIVSNALEILKGRGEAPPPILSTGIANPSSTDKWLQLPHLTDSDLANVLAGSEFMVYPSRDEGFGLPVLEAMACGVPVISSNAASLPEVAGESAIYFSPDSPHDLAASIHLLLHDDLLRERLRTSGKRRATLFSWQKAAEEIAGLYEEAMHLGPRNKVTSGTCIEKQTESDSYTQECNDAADPDFLRELGKSQKLHGDWQDAVSTFRKMLHIARQQHQPAHQRSALFHLGESLLALGDAEPAADSFKECLRICPSHKTARARLDEALTLLNSSKDSLEARLSHNQK